MKEILKKSLILSAGLLSLAFGVALSVRSGLGVSPSSSLSYLLSILTPLSMGALTVAVNSIYILIQIFLLKKEYRLMNLLQLAVVFLFGFLTDWTMSLTESLVINGYLWRLVLCVLSCAFMGLGIYLEIHARLLTMASEGAISVIADRTHKDFGQIKIYNDILFVAASLVISLVFFHRIEGVREGTLLSAILVGLFSQFFYKVLPFFKTKEEEVFTVADTYPLVITIERELGSGGHAMGMKLAKELGINFYDYELIEKTAAETGLSNEQISKKEERVNGLLYTLYNQNYAYTSEESETDAIFDAQKKIIRDIASKESCVIVGRLGAYILRNRPNAFHVFVSGDRKARARTLSEEKHLDYEETLKMLEKEDGLRASYCRHFTGKPWGLAHHYSLCIDSSVYGKEASYQLLKDAIAHFREERTAE